MEWYTLDTPNYSRTSRPSEYIWAKKIYLHDFFGKSPAKASDPHDTRNLRSLFRNQSGNGIEHTLFRVGIDCS